MNRILVVDNRDSFVYNLVEMLRVLKREIDVVDVDALRFPFDASSYSGFVLSPGAGVPAEYPNMRRLLSEFHPTHSFLGVCLGCQAIAEFFGARLLQLENPLHGHTSSMQILDRADALVQGIENPTPIGRYHSWVVDRENLPPSLRCIATEEEGYLMMLKHTEYACYGMQFHPESIMSRQGLNLVSNWLNLHILKK